MTLRAGRKTLVDAQVDLRRAVSELFDAREIIRDQKGMLASGEEMYQQVAEEIMAAIERGQPEFRRQPGENQSQR